LACPAVAWLGIIMLIPLACLACMLLTAATTLGVGVGLIGVAAAADAVAGRSPQRQRPGRGADNSQV
jgi:hypothetical protein